MTYKSMGLASAEPNVTPMLDVLLVLLIIFLAASVRIVPTMDVQLPEPCVGACAGGSAIVLEVLPGPTYRINNTPVEAPQLAARITDIYRGRPDKTIQVAGSPRVSYATVVEAMDIAKSSGVTVIGVSPKTTSMR
jgi:biopolymer transport protein TolR